MSELTVKLQSAKLKNLQTYIQSGNLIFKHQQLAAEILAGKIKGVIENEFGYQVPVIVLRAAELNEIIASNPFLQNSAKDESMLHVSYLSEMPEQTAINRLNAYADLPNEFAIGNKAVYLYCPHGYSKTKQTNNFLEKRLDVTATTRNWKTSTKLAEIANNLSSI